jgi:pSer/pThr/pTyr-binding forkhead associated (FHA) protein
MMSAVVMLGLRLAMAAVLYIFLGWVFYILWQDLRQEGLRLGGLQTPPLLLEQEQPEPARSFRFTGNQVVIGRDPASDCYIEDITISAQHARLSYHHAQWWVEDLASTNGTFVNQEAATRPLVITTGDQLRCGQVLFQVNLSKPNTQDTEIEAINHAA